MSSKNTDNSYGWVAKLFHWAVFLIIIAQYFFANNLREYNQQHFAVGVLILLVMLIRFAWRASNPVPSMPEGTSPLQTMAAHGLHILFYVLLIGMPITGIAIVQGKGRDVSFFGLFDVPRFFEATGAEDAGEFAAMIHGVVAKVILAAILIHIIVALYHHFGKKDNVLRRMLP